MVLRCHVSLAVDVSPKICHEGHIALYQHDTLFLVLVSSIITFWTLGFLNKTFTKLIKINHRTWCPLLLLTFIGPCMWYCFCSSSCAFTFFFPTFVVCSCLGMSTSFVSSSSNNLSSSRINLLMSREIVPWEKISPRVIPTRSLSKGMS